MSRQLGQLGRKRCLIRPVRDVSPKVGHPRKAQGPADVEDGIHGVEYSTPHAGFVG